MRVNIEELNFRSEADVARVQEILSRGFAKPPWNIRQASLGWSHVVKSWRSPGTKVYIAKQRGKIVGVSAGQINHSAITPTKVLAKLGEGKHYYLDMTAVDQRKLRKGVALALHLAHEENARGEKCTAIFGETHPKSRRVIGLFTKQGFRRFHADEAANHVYYKKELKQKRG